MIGTRIGEFKGIEVRRPGKSEWVLYDTSADDCIYWYGNHLFYKDNDIACVDSTGNVSYFNETLFLKLRGEAFEEFDQQDETEEQDEANDEAAESPVGDYESGIEAPVSEESATIEEMFRQSRGSVEDLLNGFDLVANRYLEEEGKRAV